MTLQKVYEQLLGSYKRYKEIAEFETNTDEVKMAANWAAAATLRAIAFVVGQIGDIIFTSYLDPRYSFSTEELLEMSGLADGLEWVREVVDPESVERIVRTDEGVVDANLG